MSPAASVPPRRRSRLLLILLLVAAAVALPVLVLVGWYASARFKDASVSKRLEAEARQRGEPVTLAELAATYPPIPEASNAAVALIEIWKKEDPDFWDAFLDGIRPLPEFRQRSYSEDLPYVGSKARRVELGAPLTPAMRQAAQEFVQGQRERSAAVRAALGRPKCRFPIQFADGPSALLPHLAKLKREARDFQIAALLAADRGDVDQSIENLGQAVATGNLLEDDPFYIGFLVRVSCLSMTVDGLEQLLSRQAPSQAQLDRLEELCSRMDLGNSLRQAMIGERVLDLSLFNLPEASLATVNRDRGEDPISPEKYRQGVRALSILGLQAADRRLMWEAMNQLIALTDLDPPGSLDRTDRLDEFITRESHRLPPRFICAICLPSVSRCAYKTAGFEARRRPALTAIAVERYRLGHQGTLPASLAQLVPEFIKAVPADPFDGQPIRYIRQPKGYVIYSLGPNRKDDGGKERPRQSTAKDYDQLFTVAR